jgi:hypothetical protein
MLDPSFITKEGSKDAGGEAGRGTGARVARAEEECAAEAGKLVALIIEASNTLVELGMLLIWEVPENPKKA